MPKDNMRSDVGFNPQRYIKQYENPTVKEDAAKARFKRKAYGGVYDYYKRDSKET